MTGRLEALRKDLTLVELAKSHVGRAMTDTAYLLLFMEAARIGHAYDALLALDSEYSYLDLQIEKLEREIKKLEGRRKRAEKKEESGE